VMGIVSPACGDISLKTPLLLKNTFLLPLELLNIRCSSM